MKKPKKVTSIPGPRSREVVRMEQRNLAPGLQGFALMAEVAIDHGRGSVVTDVDGNEYIDLIGGIGVNGLGHSHPRWVSAMQAQMEKLSVGSFTTEPRARLVKKVAEHTPPGLDQIQLYSGGSEAVESAMRLAKCHTGKWEFVSFWGGFHGKTLGTMGLLGDGQKAKYGPFAPGSHCVPYADCYRCPLRLKQETCGLACVDVARKAVKTQSAGEIAAFLVEPMQGTAGNIVPPAGWLQAIREVASEFQALLICDEMITGFGRTGSWFASPEMGVKADIITVGKSFAGGFPVAGVITSREIAEAEPWSKPSGSSSSYGGNPLAAVAALSTIEIIEEEKLCENSARMGGRLLGHLRRWKEKYPFVGEVRGKGLFLGIELVRDRATKEPVSEARMKEFYKEGVRRGVLAMSYKATIRLQPALTIDAETLDGGVAILEEMLGEMDRKGDWR
ncbi:MAG: aspartate aminotransferase family protein [Bdellovibrionales bacterium]|nr:aspartate aminotransferase family protein [Bdellovibrionales bacterium]